MIRLDWSKSGDADGLIGFVLSERSRSASSAILSRVRHNRLAILPIHFVESMVIVGL